jgi:predicted RNase H-like nuclease
MAGPGKPVTGGYVVGVDGCPGGWVSARYDLASNSLTLRVYSSFADILAAYLDAPCIAVDIPIGLEEGRPRQADVEAHKVLGPRKSSVFSSPDRRLVEVAAYADANARSRLLLDKGISRQAHAIYPRVAEVNGLLSPRLQERVVEVHPEVCFWALAGGAPMAHPKRTPEGFEERRALLASAFPGADVPSRSDARHLARPAVPDDILDAIVAAWTARRFARGEAGRMPDPPPTDSAGLRMEMVY